MLFYVVLVLLGLIAVYGVRRGVVRPSIGLGLAASLFSLVTLATASSGVLLLYIAATCEPGELFCGQTASWTAVGIVNLVLAAALGTASFFTWRSLVRRGRRPER